MTADQTRQRALLAVLFVVLAGLVWWNVLRAPTTTAPASAAAAAPRSTPRGGEAPQAIEDVALGALDEPRPAPADGERNLFRFGQRQPPRTTPAGDMEPRDPASLPTPAEPVAEAGPSGPPPIPLRFVGLVERTRAHRKIAILTDGQNTFYGAEGDIIEGQYRIVQIGTESVELAYVDGRGQQRLRLAGS